MSMGQLSEYGACTRKDYQTASEQITHHLYFALISPPLPALEWVLSSAQRAPY